MGWVTRGILLASVAGGGVATRRVLAARRQGGTGADQTTDERWHTVTVNRPLAEVAPNGQVPASLSALDDVEVRFTPAPADKGTEIAVRLRHGEPSGTGAALAKRLTGDDPRHAVRRALRETRSLLETGEVLQPDRPTTKPSLLNKPLRKVTSHGREEGLL